MGFMDKLKGMLSGKEANVKEGIDKAADHADKVVPDQHLDKVDTAAEKAKDAVDKIGDDSAGGTTPPSPGQPGQ